MTTSATKPAPEVHVPDNGRADRTRSFDPADFSALTGREEEWRFTPIRKLKTLLEPATDTVTLGYSADLPAGLTRRDTTLAEARDLGIAAPEDRAAVIAANSADHVVHYDLAADAELAETVVIRAHGTSMETAHSHLLITAGANSRGTLVIEHKGPVHLSEMVSIVVGEGSDIKVVFLQLWEEGSVHVGQHDALVAKDAKFQHIAISLGGDILRLNANVRYTGTGGEAELLGLYFADAGQHLEHRTYIDHNTPKATSNVMYKGALQGDDAHTVWVGDVLIRPEAIGIDTYELNRNLILSDGARADSVPNLEIETGDIEGAGHASSTGRFDEEHLFYLMSRGIDEPTARSLVVRGFFNEIIQKIKEPEIEAELSAAIEDELARTQA